MIGMRMRGRKPCWKTAAVASAAAAVVLMLPGTAGAAGTGSGPAALLPAPASKPVPVHAVPAHKVTVPAMTAWKRPAVTWPAAGTATAAAAPAGAPARAGSLPVSVSRPARAGDSAVGSAGSGVRVTMASRQAAAAEGVAGVIFSVSASSPAQAGQAHVSLDYSSFAFAGGGDYASRLRLVELPACALTTPGVASCRKQTPLDSSDNVTDFQLAADVTVPAAAASSPAIAAAPATAVVLAASTAPSGSAGDFSATPLSEAGTWSEGGSSGAFTYSYPVQVPPVPGALAPQVSLGYNSQSVDGLTS